MSKPKTKPILIPQTPLDAGLKDLHLSLQRVKNLLSLRVVKTIGDVFDKIGVISADIPIDWQNRLAEPTTFPEVDLIGANLKSSITRSYYIKEIESAYNTNDFILETPLHEIAPSLAIATIPSIDYTRLDDEDNLAHEIDSYLPPPNPLQTATLFKFQTRAAKDLLAKIILHKCPMEWLQAGVGVGKTFIYGQVIRWLTDLKWFKGKTFSPWPVLVVTKASVVEQTKRVLIDLFGLDAIRDVKVTHYDALRSTAGTLMLKEVEQVEDAIMHRKFKWKDGIHPVLFLWDEGQALKNITSQQSKIGQAVNDITTNPWINQIFCSASLITRVAEAKCVAVASRLKANYGIARNIPLTNSHWGDFAKEVASPAGPEEYSPAAVGRLVTRLLPYIVDVKGVRPQFVARNSCQKIDFSNEKDRLLYQQAWDRYLEEKAKIEGGNLPNSRFLILVQFLKFRQAAELIRAPYLAKAMWECVEVNGQAAACACNFKATIAKIVWILHNDYNVSRKDISLIWGGDASLSGNKQDEEKYTKAQIHEILARCMRGEDIDLKTLKSIKTQLAQQATGLDEVPKELELGVQSREMRQEEIDKYQSGRSRYCLFTFKSGGVGLSLHHTDEFTKQKVRRKKDSNWAVVEDIPLVPTRQRVCFLAPTYSAIELVQGLGRCPRLTSLSDTSQILVFYRGTIEERVKFIVDMKLRCLKKVVRQRESWEDIVVGRGNRIEDRVASHVEKDVPEEDTGNMVDVEVGDEEDSEENE